MDSHIALVDKFLDKVSKRLSRYVILFDIFSILLDLQE